MLNAPMARPFPNAQRVHTRLRRTSVEPELLPSRQGGTEAKANPAVPAGLLHFSSSHSQCRFASSSAAFLLFAASSFFHLQLLRLETAYSFVRHKGCPPLQMHGGHRGGSVNFRYNVVGDSIFTGLTVVGFSLQDISEKSGGFACIPGRWVVFVLYISR